MQIHTSLSGLLFLHYNRGFWNLKANFQIAIFSSDLILDKWTTVSTQKNILWLIFHIVLSGGPNIFLLNSLTIVIFICTEFK